jgi:hypothetical protein
MIGLIIGGDGIIRMVLWVRVLSLSCWPHVPARRVQSARLRSDGLLVIRVGESVRSWLKLSPRGTRIVDSRRILIVVVVLPLRHSL